MFGTGGTLTGVGRYFKSKGKAVHMVLRGPPADPGHRHGGAFVVWWMWE